MGHLNASQQDGVNMNRQRACTLYSWWGDILFDVSKPGLHYKIRVQKYYNYKSFPADKTNSVNVSSSVLRLTKSRWNHGPIPGDEMSMFTALFWAFGLRPDLITAARKASLQLIIRRNVMCRAVTTPRRQNQVQTARNANSLYELRGSTHRPECFSTLVPGPCKIISQLTSL